MGGSRGLMGREAFAQLRAMADAAYAAKSHPHSVFDVWFSPRSAITGRVDPVHLGVMGAGRCLSAFLPPSGIKVEYSTDGGATWRDYGAGDAYRRRLASMRDARIWYKLGGPDASGAHGDMLRITYEPSDGRYGLVRSALVWASTMGGSNLLCSVETSTLGAKGTWVKRVSPVEMGGWPGPNVVDLPGLTFGGSASQTDNTYGWRFTFSKKADVPGRIQQVGSIDLYGDSVWASANEMMRSGHLYSWDDEGNGHFVGSADSATEAAKLATARKITFTGAATGSATFDGSADVTVNLAASMSAASFLAAHPVGCVYMTTIHANPGTLYGGTWVERPSTGAFLYERTA